MLMPQLQKRSDFLANIIKPTGRRNTVLCLKISNSCLLNSDTHDVPVPEVVVPTRQCSALGFIDRNSCAWLASGRIGIGSCRIKHIKLQALSEYIVRKKRWINNSSDLGCEMSCHVSYVAVGRYAALCTAPLSMFKPHHTSHVEDNLCRYQVPQTHQLNKQKRRYNLPSPIYLGTKEKPNQVIKTPTKTRATLRHTPSHIKPPS